jgi:hypothetical protein
MTELEERISEIRFKEADLEFPNTLSRASALWSDTRFAALQELAFDLAMLRYPVASILAALSLFIATPLVVAAKGLHASWKLITKALVHSSAYSSKVLARSLGVI